MPRINPLVSNVVNRDTHFIDVLRIYFMSTKMVGNIANKAPCNIYNNTIVRIFINIYIIVNIE